MSDSMGYEWGECACVLARHLVPDPETAGSEEAFDNSVQQGGCAGA